MHLQIICAKWLMRFCHQILILVKTGQRSWYFRWRHTLMWLVFIMDTVISVKYKAVVNQKMTTSADCLLCEGWIEVTETKWNTADSDHCSYKQRNQAWLFFIFHWDMKKSCQNSNRTNAPKYAPCRHFLICLILSL